MTTFSPMILRDGLVENLPATDTLEANLASNTSRKNLLINGNFEVWQRYVGTEKTLNAAGNLYTADRWANVTSSVAGTLFTQRQSFTLGQTDVPGEPEFFLRTRRTDAGALSTNYFGQLIENVRNGAGQAVTISFWAKADASLTVTTQFTQKFGTGGSPSSDVVSGTQNNSITTAWQKFTHTLTLASISGKTIGTDVNTSALLLQFMLPLSGTYIIDFAQIQVEIGSIATQFERRFLADELKLCQRYYYKTFRQTAVPAQAIGTGDGAVCCIGGSATVNLAVHKHWPVTMRIDPIVVMYNPISANTQWRDVTNGADRTSALQPSSDNGVVVQHTAAAAADGSTNVIHLTADAEF